MLSDEHKRQRVEISQILLHRCQQEGDETVDVGPRGDHRARNKLLEHLITGDETWLHLSTPKTKRNSMTWKHPSSPVTKKGLTHSRELNYRVSGTREFLRRPISGVSHPGFYAGRKKIAVSIN
ncbi:histone-lysine N-methyltransferase SETMAR [Plakobranchus ocellatus]|uniref:Histone-lysine N-methyltransferase SETMAR n=1 Tax=Plakobranchus ocellatus TaxID=259542 RepID=A0AAV4CPM2_9GAST|nr:histone-lysine N-methyltransferase SETMAR [Plakobranchus ocellatus]